MNIYDLNLKDAFKDNYVIILCDVILFKKGSIVRLPWYNRKYYSIRTNKIKYLDDEGMIKMKKNVISSHDNKDIIIITKN